MYEAFLGLSQEKQKRIINAAMKEFAHMGYENASTNRMVAEAGISKGSLFLYFDSKQGLLSYLCRYGIDLFENEIILKMQHLPADIFERWKHAMLLKIELIANHPLVFEFFMKMMQEENHELQSLIARNQQGFYMDFQEKLYRGLDESIFVEGVDVPRVLKLIWWGLEGYAREVQNRVITQGGDFSAVSDEAYKETTLYLNLFKKAFIRQN